MTVFGCVYSRLWSGIIYTIHPENMRSHQVALTQSETAAQELLSREFLLSLPA